MHDSFYGSVLGLAALFLGILVVGRVRLGGFRSLYTANAKWALAISGEVLVVVAGALAVQAGFLDDSDGLRWALLIVLGLHLGSTLVGLAKSE